VNDLHAIGLIGAAYLILEKMTEDSPAGSPARHRNHDLDGVFAALFGGDRQPRDPLVLTEQEWQDLVPSPPWKLKIFFNLTDEMIRIQALEKGYGEQTKDDVRNAMIDMPGWFQRAWADEHFRGNVEKAVAYMEDIAEVEIPIRA
jgi:hypothetical protein